MKALLLIPILCLCSCATRPHVYAPPDPGKLKTSTTRVSVAVDKAHNHAREAKIKVDEAAKIAKEVSEETKALKDVPPTLVTKLNDLESKLDETRTIEASLEKDLVEADAAKAQVEQDKNEYFAQAQKLADAASEERSKRIADEKKLHWYRIHFFLGWVILATGIIACVVFALIKFGVLTSLKL